jgi:cytochrome c-type biogenesis protein CcmH/NrfG
MAIEGPLRELGIHDVFQLLDLSRKTGVLRVASELRDDEGVVHFDSGRVVHAHVRSKSVPLELVLLQSGKITKDDLESARAKRTNGRATADLVDLLVENGAVAQKEIERQLRMQIESVVFELMSWREGFFSFEERAAADLTNSREARIRVSTESLLMEGARRIDEWSRIADKVPSLAVVPVLAPVRDGGHGSQLDLLPPEWEVLSMIDGARDLRAIAGTLGRAEFDIARVVYGLVTTGVVEVRTPDRITPIVDVHGTEPALEQARAAFTRGAVEEALTATRAVLAKEPNNTCAHLLAARALTALNRRDEVVDELRRAVRADPLTPEVHLELGFAAVYVGDFAAARSSWEHYLRLAPTGAEVGRVRAAIEALTRLMHVLEAHAEVLANG